MKKLCCLFLILNLSIISNVLAKEEVVLSKCVDGDTAWFIYNGSTEKFRFLAIDTPESTNKIEPYGKEASEYTCSMLTNADKIEIEFDDNSSKTDKYNRYLAWIYVDGVLLQKKLLSEGLAEIKYIYGNYKYIDELKLVENKAKINKIGIWNDNKSFNYLTVILSLIIIIILYILNKKFRNKTNKKIKNIVRKKIQGL